MHAQFAERGVVMGDPGVAELVELATQIEAFTDALVADGSLFGQSHAQVVLPATARKEALRLREKAREILEEVGLRREAERAYGS
jgi:hypothetical protein